ncbi:hypothetical protein [Spiroplasma endosymbiont of Colias croceus]|uniref:hypothetical protein n=1 Tax=Spiroplasma endosymbiont of Colias croceus TaxID=3066310 RepID=UPI0030CA8EEB
MTKEELLQWENNEIGKIESIKEDKLTHKNCINKEKIIEYLIEHDTLDMELIIEYLEKGLFDNE